MSEKISPSIEELTNTKTETINNNSALIEAIKIAREEQKFLPLNKEYYNYFTTKYSQIKTPENYKILSDILRENDNHYLKEITKYQDITELSQADNHNLDSIILKQFLTKQIEYSKKEQAKRQESAKKNIE